MGSALPIEQSPHSLTHICEVICLRFRVNVAKSSRQQKLDREIQLLISKEMDHTQKAFRALSSCKIAGGHCFVYEQCLKVLSKGEKQFSLDQSHLCG